ncbi:PBECR4 domain-containing protein [Streptobacillus moniliformis]|uniref:PBECR4 domain-containing protein n=1 Tax=Streptobacillus moniliformis TaxID=34105 RepID=UPI0007E46C65|nr:PBECR4 domain-containing protein [Streptobacillus moniliformis]
MKKTYKVQEILNKMKKLNNIEFKIKGETKEFDIDFSQKNIPHLLGLQYINEKNNEMKGRTLLRNVISNNYSDEEILNKVEKNHGEKQMQNVKNRIDTFEAFMNNLEKGFIVEKTLDTKMNVNYLIIQSKKNEYYHLGIYSDENCDFILNFDELSEKEKDIIKTYFVEDNIEYFDKSNIIEEIQSISKYRDDKGNYIPFSFDEDKNIALLEEYERNKDFNYREFLKEFENNKENIWNVNKDEKDVYFER